MRIGEIDIPSDILAAQRDGKLVIFAGAGVSRDPPSEYPDFAGLVAQIGSGARVVHESGEPDDHYLGRLQDDQVAVHELARKILFQEDSRPNALHTALVRLFSGSEVRIVTTNVDKHFTDEGRRLRSGELEIWTAPAFPLGNAFSGLVYIHGSVEGPADRLVLTDRDFSRAYLTEGWARRFLLGLYAEYTVLFVGYSHNDTVLSYLVRGMAPSGKRLFALTPDGATDHWKFLGVEPITYPLKGGKDAHGSLRESLVAWADRTEMGVFDHEQKIKDLLAGRPPQVKSEDDDYLIETMGDSTRLHVFLKHAVGKTWLLWAEERGILTPLFSRREESNERHAQLAWWFSRQGVLAESEAALGIFYRHKQILSRNLWHAVAQAFHSMDNPNAVSLQKWLPILLAQTTQENHAQLLEYLFKKAAVAGSWPLSFLLFEYLTRPRLYVEESYAFLRSDSDDADQTRSEIGILGSEYGVNEAWEKVFKPNMSVVARDVLYIAANNIGHAYNLSVCHGIAKPEWDPLSFHRSAIEPHEQDQLDHPFDTVINACRDSLEWLAAHHKQTARAIVRDWLKTTAPLLRRVAIHCLRLDKGISPDRKLRRVMADNLRANIALHHELFTLLRDAYPAASVSARKAFLNYACHLTEVDVQEASIENKDIYWHSLFTLMSWLDMAAQGKCSLVKTRLQRLKRKYPTFRMSEHPDFTHWSGVSGFYIPESPLSVDEMLNKPILEVVSLLLSYKKSDMFGPNRNGLLTAITSATKKNAEWGVALAVALPKDSSAPLDAITHLLWGWREAELTEDQWRLVLKTLGRNPALLTPDRDAAMFLEHGVNKEKDRIPESLMPLAERVACRIWQIADKHSEKSADDSNDWLSKSINASGGQITEFFITAISIRRKQAGTEWSGLPATLKKQLDRIIISRKRAGEMGRIILASQLHFLFSCDPEWTRKRVLPLLSWRRNTRQAIQGWHGYAHWGRWYDELLPDLLPLYEDSFSRLDTELNSIREQFAAQIAGICLFSSRKQTRGRWLGKFLQSVTPSDRLAFAEAIRSALWDLKPERAAKIWHDWLNEYWKNRLMGKPVPLDPAEASKMVEWVPHLGPAFPEAVQRLEQTKLSLKANQFVYHLLTMKGVHKDHPLATTQLLKILVKSSYENIADHGDLPKVIRDLAKDPSTHVLLNDVLEHMASKGSDKVAELRPLLTSTKPD